VRADLVLALCLSGCALSAAADDDRESTGPAACDFELVVEGSLGEPPAPGCWRIRTALDARVTTTNAEDPCEPEAATCIVLPPGESEIRLWAAPGYDGPSPLADVVYCSVRCSR
jgi:hypothetical protein